MKANYRLFLSVLLLMSCWAALAAPQADSAVSNKIAAREKQIIDNVVSNAHSNAHPAHADASEGSSLSNGYAELEAERKGISDVNTRVIDMLASNGPPSFEDGSIDKMLKEARAALAEDQYGDVRTNDLGPLDTSVIDAASSDDRVDIDALLSNAQSALVHEEFETGPTNETDAFGVPELGAALSTELPSPDRGRMDALISNAQQAVAVTAPGEIDEASVDEFSSNVYEQLNDTTLDDVSGDRLPEYRRDMTETITSEVIPAYDATGAVAEVVDRGPAEIDTNIYITLRECIAMGVEGNLGLTIDRYNPAIEWEGMRLERSVFDPQFYGLVQWSETKQPTVYEKYFVTGDSKLVIGNRETERTEYQGKITGKFITGLEYSFGMGQTRNFSDSSSFGWRTEYTANSVGSIMVPLLKGFGIGVNLAPLRIQRNNWRISRIQLDETVQNLVTDIIRAYWVLYYFREDASAKEYTLELALELLKINVAKVKVGMAAPLEVTQAKARIARQEEELIIAENNILDAEDRLREIINYKMAELVRPKAFQPFSYHLVPLEKPEVARISLDQRRYIEMALEYRQVLEVAGLQLRNADETIKIAKNNLLPELNVKAALGYEGLGGNFGNAYDDEYTGRHPDWSVGIEVSFPLFYNEPVATYRRAKYAKRQAEVTVKQTKQQVVIEVRTAVRGVETDRKRIYATREGTKEAREQLRAEQEKFNVGQATTYNVLDMQEDLAIALSSEIRALADWRVSLAELHRVTAQTLRESNIKIDDFYSLPEEEVPSISDFIWSEGP